MSNYWASRVADETWKKYNSYEEQNKNLLEFYKEAIYDIESELQRLMLKLGDKPSRTDMYDKNRLEKLKKRLEVIVKDLGSNTLEHGNKLIQQAIKEQYEDVITTISNEDFALPNKKEMEMMMNNPWSGMNFSERVWENNRILASNLNEILTRGIIQGKSFSDMAKELDDRMMKGFKKAHTLVRTETMHYMNESSKKAYKDVGVNELEIYAAEDERTCEVCGAEHEKTYPMDQAPILPFHPNCRCTYLPVINKKSKSEDEVAATKSTNDIYVKKDILLKDEEYHIRKGTYIKNVEVFAKGLKIREVGRLVDKYKLLNGNKTSADDWEKVKGWGNITNGTIERVAEIHWYQCKNIGKVEYKEKIWNGVENED